MEHYNSVRLHGAIGFVTPLDTSKIATSKSLLTAIKSSNQPAKPINSSVKTHPKSSLSPALKSDIHAERVKKIAHVTTVDSSLRSLLLNQLVSLKAAGYDITGISAPGADVGPLEAASIRHFSVPMTRHLTPLTDLFSLCQLYWVMRNQRFTIVHTHTPKAGLLGQLAARLAGVPVIVNTVHGFYFHEHMRPAARRFYITLEKIAARCSISSSHKTPRILKRRSVKVFAVSKKLSCWVMGST